VYPVAYAVTAGAVPEVPLARGQVVRVTTGAAVSPGADAVVMVEATRLARTDADGREAEVEVTQAVRPGDNIRPIGCDLAPGERVLAAGDTVRAPELGLLAALGVARLHVHRRPVVAVLSTGDELVDAVAARTNAPRGAQIRDSNRPTLLQAVRDAGCTPHDAGIASDACVPGSHPHKNNAAYTHTRREKEIVRGPGRVGHTAATAHALGGAGARRCVRCCRRHCKWRTW
jgi:gephyrin